MSEHAIPKVTSPVAIDTPNYPRDHWWVAATSAELANSPIERTLLGLPVVLYRRGNEEAVALDGRCPHRWAPLSMGSIEGDEIVCRYHGLRFNPEGKYTLIPTQDRIPHLQKVRAYPIVEQRPFIWIWTGDLEAVNAAGPPTKLLWAADSSRVKARGAMDRCVLISLRHLEFVKISKPRESSRQIGGHPANADGNGATW